MTDERSPLAPEDAPGRVRRTRPAADRPNRHRTCAREIAEIPNGVFEIVRRKAQTHYKPVNRYRLPAT